MKSYFNVLFQTQDRFFSCSHQWNYDMKSVATQAEVDTHKYYARKSSIAKNFVGKNLGG
jgi:hypothetical protein